MFSIRNIALVGGGILLTGSLIYGWGTMSSYIRTGANMAGETAQNMVPVGFEIERLETLVNDLDETVAHHRARLVKQQVDLDYLRQEAERANERVVNLNGEVRAAKVVLAVHRNEYRIGDRMFSRDRVINEATAKAEDLTRAKSIAEAKNETLATLEQALGQAQQQVDGAKRQREAYSMRLAELRANAENVAIRKELVTTLGTLPGTIDSGAFQQVDDAFVRVERELQVQNRLLDDAMASAPRADAINFKAPESGDVIAILDRALGETTEPAVDDTQLADSRNNDDHLASTITFE